MSVKLVVCSAIFDVVSVYAPQIGFDEDINSWSRGIRWRLLKEVFVLPPLFPRKIPKVSLCVSA